MAINQSTEKPDAEKKPGARNRIVTAIVVALAVVGLVVFCVIPRVVANRTLVANAKLVRSQLPQVLFVNPQPAPDSDLTLPGNLEATRDAVIAARTTGYVRERYVDIGDRVKAGQLLAEIEAPDVDASSLQAGQQTLQAQAGVGEAKSDVANKLATVSQNVSNVKQAEANVEQASALEANAEAKFAQAESQVDSARAMLSQQQHVVDIKRAALAQANTQLHLADVTLKRYQTLLKNGYVALEDVDQNEATYKTAQAAVNSAEADLRSAEAGVQSAQSLVQSGQANVTAAHTEVVAARKNVLAIAATVNAALATVAAAQANVHVSEESVQANLRAESGARQNQVRFQVERGFSRVVAPFDGVITSRNVDVGTLVTSGAGAGGSTPATSSGSTTVTGSASTASATPTTTPSGGLFGLASTDILRAVISVPQTFAMQMRPGIKVSIVISEWPGKQFKGVVSNVSGAIDTVSRTLLTEVRVPNPDGRLLPGMYVQVHFVLPKTSGALLIPSNSLTYDSHGTSVEVVTPDSAIHIVPVKVGRDFGTQLEILEGLTGKERIVTNPSDSLVEGMKVQAKASPPDKSASAAPPGGPAQAVKNGSTPIEPSSPPSGPNKPPIGGTQ